METEFAGGRKAKLWTYIIIGMLLIVGILIFNFAIKNPETAEKGFDAFLGLPNWAFVAIAGGLGIIIFYLGLKIETDWPEFIGALLIAGALLAAEIMFGWDNFELGGIAVIPYILPVAVFLVLIVIGMTKSR
jgi:hypothetical protein